MLALAAAVSVGCSADARAPGEPAARYVASQVIVKFRSDTDGGAAVATAMAGDLERDAGLAAAVSSLGDRVGAPLLPRQVTSGREVLVSIDLGLFVDQVASQLVALEPVASASSVPQKGTGPESAIVFELRLEEGSREAAALAAASAAGETEDERVGEWVTSTAEELQLPLNYFLDANGRLLVGVDLLKLTEELASRIGKLDEVEYAELNQLFDFVN